MICEGILNEKQIKGHPNIKTYRNIIQRHSQNIYSIIKK